MNSFKSSCKLNVFTSIQKEVWIGWVSSLVEAYNMAIYSFFAPFLAKFLFHHTKNAVFFSYALILIASSFLYPLGLFNMVTLEINKEGKKPVYIQL